MSIPPLLSRSPPPICELSDEEDDDFGNYVVSSEFSVEISSGDVLDDFSKKIPGGKYEDTTSEDSGLCMGSIGQNQSPSDNSPVLSANKSSSNLNTQESGKSDFLFIPLENDITKGGIIDECAENESSEGNNEDIDLRNTISKAQEVTDSYLNSNVQSSLFSSEYELTHNLDKTDCSSHSDLSGSQQNDHQTPCDINDIENEETENCTKESLFENSSKFDVNDVENGRDILEPDMEFDSYYTPCVSNEEDVVDENGITGANKSIVFDLEESVVPEISSKDNPRTLDCDFESDVNEDRPHPNEEFVIPKPEKPPKIENTPLVLNSIHSEFNSSSYDVSNSVDSEDDDFTDFTDFQSCSTSDVQPVYNPEDAWTEWWPQVEVASIITTNLKTELEMSRTWIQLCQFDKSPVLSYQWNSSVSNCKLLSALNIDSRNILFGPWNKNKFISSDGLDLKSPNSRDMQDTTDLASSFKDPVPDAHFDWVGSGLVNPLDCVSTTLLDLQLLSFTRASNAPNDSRGSHDKPKHPEVHKISPVTFEFLKTLPDLTYMRKTFIVFPKCVT